MAFTISANLGFLWTELALPDAIRAAGAAGFDAVEFHDPYDYDPREICDALGEAKVSATSLNTRKGDQPGDFGLAAIPGREQEATDAIDEAIAYARQIDCANVSVLAGIGERSPEADDTLVENLAHAAVVTEWIDTTILIEPINTTTVPGYYLSTIGHALEIIERTRNQEIRLLIDCFHTSMTEGDVLDAIAPHLNMVGHIQIASVPGRAEPDAGDIDYPRLFEDIHRCGGYEGHYGAEYHPSGAVEDRLDWLRSWKAWGGPQ